MIKFIEKEEVKQLTLKDVEHDQFFVSLDGRLCQKIFSDEFAVLTDTDGYPRAFYQRTSDEYMPIRRIINIERIEF